MAETKPTITYEDFVKLDLRMARVLEVSDHPNADKLICLTIDIGGEQRQIIAGLKGHYSPEALLGKDIAVVVNLQPRKMRGLESNGMLLAAVYEEGGAQKVVALTADTPVPPGAAIS